MESGWNVGMESGIEDSHQEICVSAMQPSVVSRSLGAEVQVGDFGNADSEKEPTNWGREPEKVSGNDVSRGHQAKLAFGKGCMGQASQDSRRPVVEDYGDEGEELEAEDSGEVTTESLIGLLMQQSYKCALTGRQLTPANCVVDHINPFSGGDANHVMDNLQLIVDAANTAKGTMSQLDFIALCRDVARLHADTPYPPA